MTKATFLTTRWNNILSLGLGIPALLYVIFAIYSSLWPTINGLIWLAVIGALY